MSTVLDLHGAIRALWTGSVTHHTGQAPDDAAAPWIVTGFDAPDHYGPARVGTLVVTVAALTESQANFIAAAVDDTFSGARVAVDGFTVGALLADTPTGPYPAGLDATDTNLRFQVVRLPFRFTYSRT